MTVLAVAVAFPLLLWASLLYLPFRWRPLGPYLITPKVFAVGYVPLIAALGIVLVGQGALIDSSWTVAAVGVAAVGALAVMVRVGAVRPDLAAVFGSDRDDRIPPDRRAGMVTRWWRGRLPRSPEPRVRQSTAVAVAPWGGASAGMRSFTFRPVGPFSLAASSAYLEQFPGAGVQRTDAGDLAMAFVADREWVPVGVELSQRRSGVNGRFWGEASAEDVRRQVQRVFSLDVDARRLPELAERDPVVAGLLFKYWGLRPVCFWSPYEAAVWAVIGHGVKMTQAASIKDRLTVKLGHEVVVNGRPMKAFPSPQRLEGVDRFPGLGGRKPEYLRAVAAAALAGDLDGDRLRDLPRQEALAALQRIPGIGQLSAELILIRGAGDPDVAPPRQDKRLMAAIADAYELGHAPHPGELAAITDGWRPFRSWVSFLLSARADGLDCLRERREPATRT